MKRWAGAAMMVGVPLLILIGLRTAVSLDARFFSPDAHLLAVGGIALCATTIAIFAAVAARAANQAGLILLSIGAAGVGLLMLGHGLTTPGVLSQPPNPWVGRFPHLALALFALTMMLAGRRNGDRLGQWVARHSTAALVVGIGAEMATTAVFTIDPTIWASPAWEENATDLLSVGAITVSLAVLVRHWRRWHLGQDVVQLALTFAAAMIVAATASLQHGIFQQLSWWDYHAYLLAGFGCAVFAIVSRARRHRRVAEALTTAFSDDVMTHITDGYPEALVQLVKAVEIKDAYTHGHSRRTARVATELGVRLGLPGDRLRVIARGAYLHDLGKIGIPDHILNKPGRLSVEERMVIETHPSLGHEMALTAPSLHEALPVILHHHERFDGTGYPNGLSGLDIPLEARVVAVADVWDALTSDRAYRKGWPMREALAHIDSARGSHFDPRVVDGMIELAAEWGVTLTGGFGDPDEAWEAVQTCHQTDENAELVGT